MDAANARGVFAMDCHSALAMNSLRILRMHVCLARPMSVAHEPAKVEPVIMRNFAPAFPGLMQRDNMVKTLASGGC